MAKFDWVAPNHFTTYKGHDPDKEHPKTVRRLDRAGVLPADHPIRDCSKSHCGVAEEDIRGCPRKTLDCPSVCHFAKALFDEKVVAAVHKQLARGREHQWLVTIMRRRFRVALGDIHAFDKTRIERSVSRYLAELREEVGGGIVAWGRVEADIGENCNSRFHIHLLVYSERALPNKAFKRFAPGEKRGSLAKMLRDLGGARYAVKGEAKGAKRADDINKSGERRSKPLASFLREYQRFQFRNTHRQAIFMFGCRFDRHALTITPWPYRNRKRR